MKRITVLLLAVLTLSLSASASVKVWAYNEPWKGAVAGYGSGMGDANLVHVMYDATSEANNVRAFAVNIKLADPNSGENALIDYVIVGSYHVGECNSTDRGYGIFPGSIQIDAGGNVTDDGCPVVGGTVDDVNGIIDLDVNSMIIEMGSLYTGANSPPKSGELLQFRVNNKVCSVVITEDTQRGGVVMENPNQSVSVVLPYTQINAPGDITGAAAMTSPRDGYVKGADFSQLSDSWKKASTDPLYDPRANLNNGIGIAPDVGGKVKGSDFSELSDHWRAASDWR